MARLSAPIAVAILATHATIVLSAVQPLPPAPVEQAVANEAQKLEQERLQSDCLMTAYAQYVGIGGCENLTQIRKDYFALALASCKFQQIGRPAIDCPLDETRPLSDTCGPRLTEKQSDWWHEELNHIDSTCYYAESRVWRQTVNQVTTWLLTSSNRTATLLGDAVATGVVLKDLQLEAIEIQKQAHSETLAAQRLAIEDARQAQSNIAALRNEITYTQADLQNLHIQTQDSYAVVAHTVSQVANYTSTMLWMQGKVMSSMMWVWGLGFYSVLSAFTWMVTAQPQARSARFWIIIGLMVALLAEFLILKGSTGGSSLGIQLPSFSAWWGSADASTSSSSLSSSFSLSASVSGVGPIDLPPRSLGDVHAALAHAMGEDASVNAADPNFHAEARFVGDVWINFTSTDGKRNVSSGGTAGNSSGSIHEEEHRRHGSYVWQGCVNLWDYVLLPAALFAWELLAPLLEWTVAGCSSAWSWCSSTSTRVIDLALGGAGDSSHYTTSLRQTLSAMDFTRWELDKSLWAVRYAYAVFTAVAIGWAWFRYVDYSKLNYNMLTELKHETREMLAAMQSEVRKLKEIKVSASPASHRSNRYDYDHGEADGDHRESQSSRGWWPLFFSKRSSSSPSSSSSAAGTRGPIAGQRLLMNGSLSTVPSLASTGRTRARSRASSTGSAFSTGSGSGRRGSMYPPYLPVTSAAGISVALVDPSLIAAATAGQQPAAASYVASRLAEAASAGAGSATSAAAMPSVVGGFSGVAAGWDDDGDQYDEDYDPNHPADTLPSGRVRAAFEAGAGAGAPSSSIAATTVAAPALPSMPYILRPRDPYSGLALCAMPPPVPASYLAGTVYGPGYKHADDAAAGGAVAEAGVIIRLDDGDDADAAMNDTTDNDEEEEEEALVPVNPIVAFESPHAFATLVEIQEIASRRAREVWAASHPPAPPAQRTGSAGAASSGSAAAAVDSDGDADMEYADDWSDSDDEDLEAGGTSKSDGETSSGGAGESEEVDDADSDDAGEGEMDGEVVMRNGQRSRPASHRAASKHAKSTVPTAVSSIDAAAAGTGLSLAAAVRASDDGGTHGAGDELLDDAQPTTDRSTSSSSAVAAGGSSRQPGVNTTAVGTGSRAAATPSAAVVGQKRKRRGGATAAAGAGSASAASVTGPEDVDDGNEVGADTDAQSVSHGDTRDAGSTDGAPRHGGHAASRRRAGSAQKRSRQSTGAAAAADGKPTSTSG